MLSLTLIRFEPAGLAVMVPSSHFLFFLAVFLAYSARYVVIGEAQRSFPVEGWAPRPQTKMARRARFALKGTYRGIVS